MENSQSDVTPELNWFAMMLLPIPVWIFFGNLTVLVVIAENISLRRIWSNKIIFSLALTDMTISVVVMPFAAIGQLCNGHWPFGLGICAFHVISDVYFCSSSIMHLLLIAVNRYAAIGWPLSYRRVNVAVGLQAVLLLGVWCIPLLIATPLFIQILLDPEGIYKDGHCDIFYNHFILYGSISTFYFPLMVMIAVDIRSFFLLRSKSKNSERLKSIARGGLNRSVIDTRSNFRKRTWLAAMRLRQLLTKRPRDQNNEDDSNKMTDRHQTYNNTEAAPRNSNGSNNRFDPTAAKAVKKSTHAARIPLKRRNSLPEGTSKNAFLKKQSRSMSSSRMRPSTYSISTLMSPVKKFFMKQRAETALLTVFIVFVICWMPFFTINVLQTIVPAVKQEDVLFLAFVWLGYCSSGLNPIIYPLFNSEYRKCFMKTFGRATTEEQAQPRGIAEKSVTSTNNMDKYESTPPTAHERIHLQRSAPSFPRITSQSMSAIAAQNISSSDWSITPELYIDDDERLEALTRDGNKRLALIDDVSNDE